ncbi:MAG: 50S ribosomal protein L17 [Bacteroidota bacterium]
MRHRKRGRKLNRTTSHRKALLSGLSASLLKHKKIRTTVAKAKETRRVVERLITKAKNARRREQEGGPKDVHARRQAYRYLRDREAVTALFADVAEKVSNRPGGYTRVVKLGQRYGDGAELAVIQLVDYSVSEPASPKKTEKEKKQSKAEKPKTKEGRGKKRRKREEAEKSTSSAS